MSGVVLKRLFLDGIQFWNSDGLCNRYARASDELIRVAKELRAELEELKVAPNPFASFISTVHNNQEFEKFLEHSASPDRGEGI